MFQLRPYQRDAIDSIYSYFSKNSGNPLLVLPTGSGKSLINAAFIKEVLETWPDQRILCLTHVKELIEQNHNKLRQNYPDGDIGIYSSAMKRRDIYHHVIFAGIQSVYKKAIQLGKFDLIMIDECDLVNIKNCGMYRYFIDDMIRINPKLKIIGMTATDFRTGTGSIIHGEHRIFTDIAFKIGLIELIEMGYLSSLISKRMKEEVNTDDIHVICGEFSKSGSEEAFDTNELTEAALDEVSRFAQDRLCWIFFCSGVDHAYHVRDALRRRGISAECLEGNVSQKDRDRIIEDYRSGKIKAITNVDVMTTGTDVPRIDLLVWLRPTQSKRLYVQVMGRGMRLSPETGKSNCLVLDFAGNVMRHGPVDQVTSWIPQKKKKKTTSSMKACPECQTIVPVQTRTCPQCGFEYPFEHKDPHSREAYSGSILSTDIQDPVIKEYAVSSVEYFVHRKKNSNPSMRVEYMHGLTVIAKEWVFFEKEGFAQRRAVNWWKERGLLPIPNNTTEAVVRANNGELRHPRSMTINETPKYPEIMNFNFNEDEEIYERKSDKRTNIDGFALT